MNQVKERNFTMLEMAEAINTSIAEEPTWLLGPEGRKRGIPPVQLRARYLSPAKNRAMEKPYWDWDQAPANPQTRIFHYNLRHTGMILAELKKVAHSESKIGRNLRKKGVTPRAIERATGRLYAETLPPEKKEKVQAKQEIFDFVLDVMDLMGQNIVESK